MKNKENVDELIRVYNAKLYDIWVQNPDTTERMFAKEEGVKNWLAKEIDSIYQPEQPEHSNQDKVIFDETTKKLVTISLPVAQPSSLQVLSDEELKRQIKTILVNVRNNGFLLERFSVDGYPPNNSYVKQILTLINAYVSQRDVDQKVMAKREAVWQEKYSALEQDIKSLDFNLRQQILGIREQVAREIFEWGTSPCTEHNEPPFPTEIGGGTIIRKGMARRHCPKCWAGLVARFLQEGKK